MACPGCKAEVDSEQDFCLECGEPIAGMKPARPTTAQRPTVGQPAAPAVEQPAAPAVAQPGAAAAPSVSAARAVKRRRVEEPEPQRCPGCGTKTLARRCPGCGTPLRHDDDDD